MSNRRNTARLRRATSRPGHKPWQPYLRLPPFLPVPVRSRRDGWTPERQARFIGLLAQGGCVRSATQALGLSRESAYRLRRHPGAGSFRAAWDTAITGRTQPRWKFTRDERRPLGHEGAFRVRLWQGRLVGISRKPCDSRLLADYTSLERIIARLPDALVDRLLGYADPLAHLRRLLSTRTPALRP